MTLNELRQSLPNKVGDGKGKQPKDRNAFENLYILQNTLRTYIKEQKDSGNEVDPEIEQLQKNVRYLCHSIKRDSNVKDDLKKSAEEAFDNGTLADQMNSVMKKLNNGQIQAGDKKDTIIELIQRSAAGLEFINVDVPNQYRLDNEEAKKQTIKDRDALIKADRDEEARIIADEKAKNNAYNQRIAVEVDKVWCFGDNEVPTAYDFIDRLKINIEGEYINEKTGRGNPEYLKALMAARLAVNSERNSGSSLKKPLTKAAFTAAYKQIDKSEFINGYLKNNGARALKGLALRPGHGGEFEDDIKRSAIIREKMPADVPGRFMPTALERTERCMEVLASKSPYSNAEDIVLATAGLFAARQAADSKRGSKSSLKVKLDAESLSKYHTQLEKCEAFKDFVRENKQRIIEMAGQKGHGGAIEDLFREHVAKMDVLPELDSRYMPTPKMRTEALKAKISSPDFARLSDEEKKKIYKEIFIARTAGDVRRNNSTDLNKNINPYAYDLASRSLRNNKKLDDFLNLAMVRGQLPGLALNGHGGDLEDKFKAYLREFDAEPDVNERYKRGHVWTSPAKAEEEPKNDRYVRPSDELKAVKETMDDFFKNGELDPGKLKAEENMLKYNAAKAMCLTHMRKEGYAAVATSVIDDRINKIMEKPAFDNMFKTLGAEKVADLIIDNESELVTAFAKEEENIKFPMIEEVDEEMNASMDEKSVDGEKIDDNNIIKINV